MFNFPCKETRSQELRGCDQPSWFLNFIFSIQKHPKWKTFEWLQRINSHYFLCHVQYKRCHIGSEGFGKKIWRQASPWGHWCALHVGWYTLPRKFLQWTPKVIKFFGQGWGKNRILGGFLIWKNRISFSVETTAPTFHQKIWKELRKEKKWVNWTNKLCGDKTVQQNPALVGTDCMYL